MLKTFESHQRSANQDQLSLQSLGLAVSPFHGPHPDVDLSSHLEAIKEWLGCEEGCADLASIQLNVAMVCAM
jgi:hypothetical protein